MEDETIDDRTRVVDPICGMARGAVEHEVRVSR